mgnify:CR=1 FL=1
MRRIAQPAALVLAGLAAACMTAQPREDDYVAQFNEPFLTFVSEGERLVLTRPGGPGATTIAAQRAAVPGGVQFDGRIDPAEPESRFRLTITRQFCEDDMAGLPFSHHAQLDRGAALQLRPHQGCARMASEPQPQE